MNDSTKLDVIKGAIPWQARSSISVHTHEFIQPSTLNRNSNRLLENDIFLSNILTLWNETSILESDIDKTLCDVEIDGDKQKFLNYNGKIPLFVVE